MKNKYFTGVVEDPRPKKEKAKDWTAEEILSGSSDIKWEEKKKWKTYTERNQYRTSSCVPQSIAKILEINEKNETGKSVVFSATKAYAERTNNGEGSWLQEMLKYAVEPAYYTTEKELVSQGLSSDKEMETIAKEWNSNCAKIAKKYSGKSYLQINNYNNIDSVAEWVNKGYGVSILIYGDFDEWKLKYPKIKRDVNIFSAPIRHAITVVDFGLINGVKYLKIEDSSHFGNRSERWVNEEFINKRCYGAGFVFDKPNERIPEIINEYKFSSYMKFGMWNNQEVVKLQDRLKKEGFFPKHIPSTGNYLTITQSAVHKFQVANNIASQWELNLVNGRIVGPKTIKFLNAKRN